MGAKVRGVCTYARVRARGDNGTQPQTRGQTGLCRRESEGGEDLESDEDADADVRNALLTVVILARHCTGPPRPRTAPPIKGHTPHPHLHIATDVVGRGRGRSRRAAPYNGVPVADAGDSGPGNTRKPQPHSSYNRRGTNVHVVLQQVQFLLGFYLLSLGGMQILLASHFGMGASLFNALLATRFLSMMAVPWLSNKFLQLCGNSDSAALATATALVLLYALLQHLAFTFVSLWRVLPLSIPALVPLFWRALLC